MKSRGKIASLVTAVIGLLLIPATAFAYAPTGDDFITCVAGDDRTVECAAGIFDPNTDVDVLVEINPVLLDTTVTSDANGEIDFAYDVPADQSGEVTVTLTGTKNGETFVLASTVATATESEVIANAGSNAGLLALGALGALAIGGGALVASRRKRTETTETTV